MKPFSEPFHVIMDRMSPHILMATITACCGSGEHTAGLDSMAEADLVMIFAGMVNY